MNKFVFVVLCALLVGEVLGEAALGNYYKDVVREQHELINEMNQNFTELEKASEKLIDLGLYVGKHKLPPKTIKITKTVAVKVPVPFPVKVPEPVPVPVPVSKPVPVPVPTLVAIPVESTAATAAAATVTGGGGSSTGGPTPSSPVPADADPASSQAHPSTVQLQEYVQSFPIHSVYDAGDDYNPMEGNRLALAEHTATPTESTFSKPSPSSLQQLEEYQQHQYHHRHQQHHHHHHQHATGQHSQQSKHHQRHHKPAQAGSHASAEQYYGGHGGSSGGSSGGQRQYHVGGAQVQAGAHTAAKFRPESHAHQPTAESYDFGSDVVGQFDATSYARATDSPYSAAAGHTGGKSAPSAPSGISEGYHYTSEHEQQQQQQQQFQRGNHGESIFEPQQFGGAGGGGRGAANGGGRIGGAAIGGAGGVGGAGTGAEAGAHAYVEFGEGAGLQAHHEAATVPRFEAQSEAALQTPLQAGFQAGLQAGLQTTLEAGLQATREAELQAEQAAEKGAHRPGAGGKTKEINDLTPRPFQLARDTYPRYEKPDFARYNANQRARQQQHRHHEADRLQEGRGRGGDSTGSVLPEGYDYPAFAESDGPAAAAAAAGGAVPATEAHGYAVSGERPATVSTAGYHHTHPYPADVSGQAHQGVRHQAVDAGADPFPFYHATKHDPHLVRAGLKPHHADAAPGGPSFQLQQHFGEHAESAAGAGTAAPALQHNFHHHHHILVGAYDAHAEREHQQHDQFGQKHTASYGSSAKPTVYSVPSDAHLYPDYNAAADHDNHGTGHDNHGPGTSGKFHYHFHNVHPVGGGGDHQQSAASEHQYRAVHAGHAGQYGGAAGPDGSLVTSYDPPASGNTYHFHDDGTDDMFAGASDVQEQLRAPYGHAQ